ncbi:MAG: hypothetical protein AB1775_01355 [Bacteroidota bacterium]
MAESPQSGIKVASPAEGGKCGGLVQRILSEGSFARKNPRKTGQAVKDAKG